MGIFIFIVILLVLILVHEWGHFATAKLFKIKVHEFGIGFPPKIFGREFGGTLYSVNALPFGGFVKIAGEDSEEDTITPPEEKITAKPRWIQALVIFAGVGANLLLAWFLFSGGLMAGIPGSVSSFPKEYVSEAELILTNVIPDGPASRAGLLPGDKIVSVPGIVDISPETVSLKIAQSEGRAIDVHYERKGETLTTTLLPEKGIISERYAVGISMDMVGTVKLPPLEAIFAGARITASSFVSVAKGFFGLISDAFRGEGSLSSVTGPVGIASMVGDAQSLGFVYLISFTAFLSINLAFINLVPFPALDGGRLFFLFIEGLTRRPLSPKFVFYANALGFLILIGLMILVTYQDIARLIP